jgi:hypothetical protein
VSVLSAADALAGKPTATMALPRSAAANQRVVMFMVLFLLLMSGRLYRMTGSQ